MFFEEGPENGEESVEGEGEGAEETLWDLLYQT